MDEVAVAVIAVTGLAGMKTVVVEDLAALPSVVARQPLQTTKRNGTKLKKVSAFTLTTSSRSQYLKLWLLYYITLLYLILHNFCKMTLFTFSVQITSTVAPLLPATPTYLHCDNNIYTYTVMWCACGSVYCTCAVAFLINMKMINYKY